MLNLNPAKPVLTMAKAHLAGETGGQTKGGPTKRCAPQEGDRGEDDLNYDEPPGWYLPLRQRLGAVLLRPGGRRRRKKCFGRPGAPAGERLVAAGVGPESPGAEEDQGGRGRGGKIREGMGHGRRENGLAIALM